MSILKRTFAVALCLALMITCFAGCHQKGEIAVTVGDYEFSSGYYACALVFADTQARALVEDDLSKEGDLPDDIDYYKYKVEDTDYVEWVEKTALDTIKSTAALKTLCAKADVKLSEETEASAKSNAEYLWDKYGYSYLMEANGVSEATFTKYMTDSYLADEYFEYLYGEGGEKEIAADKLTEQLKGEYALVNKIEVDFSSKTEEEITALRNQFTTYETALKNGSMTFEEVYLDYNEISAEEHTHEEAEEGELSPQDHHATVIGGEDTGYASDYYDDAKDMATGEVKIITLDDEAGLVLLVKKDIIADPYYLETLDSTLRQDIVGDEFTDDIDEYGKGLKCNVNKSSIKQFKVKKIEYPA